MSNHAADLIVAIDLETTGLGHVATPPRQDWILEIGICNCIPMTPLRCGYYGNWAARVALPPEAAGDFSEALAVNRIALESLHVGMGVDEAIRQAIWKIEDAWSFLPVGAPRHLVAFNVHFDRPFLESCPRWRRWADVAEIQWVCAMGLAAEKFSRRSGRISLRTACSEAGIEMDPGAAHRAAYDARLALQVARYCARDWRAVPPTVPSGGHP